MKILPLVNTLKKDMAISSIHLKKATNDGIEVAKRTARIYRQGNVTKYINTARSISDKLIKGTNREEIPYIAAAIGFVTPIPMMSLVMMGVGYIIRFSLPDKKDANKKSDRKHINEIV